MRLPSYLLALSIAANGLMASIVLMPRTVQIAREETTAAPTAIAETPPRATTRLSWSALASEDFETLAANLKRLGCSNQRIADLIAPEVHREAQRQIIAAGLEQMASRFAWLPHPDWAAICPEELDFKALEEEHEARLVRLFGPAEGGESRRFADVPAYDPWLDADVFSPIGKDLAEQLHRFRNERERELKRLRALAEPPSPEEVRSRLEALKVRQMQGLRDAGSFREEAISEYELRSSPYADLTRSIAGVDMSSEEMRSIVAALDSSRFEHEPALARIEALLGPERFGVFQAAAREPLQRIAQDRSSIGHLLK